MKKSMENQNRCVKLYYMKVGIKQQLHIPKEQLQTTETELPILYGSIQLIAEMSKPTSRKDSSS